MKRLIKEQKLVETTGKRVDATGKWLETARKRVQMNSKRGEMTAEQAQTRTVDKPVDMIRKSCQCKWWMQVKIAQYTRAGNNKWMNEWMNEWMNDK